LWLVFGSCGGGGGGARRHSFIWGGGGGGGGAGGGGGPGGGGGGDGDGVGPGFALAVGVGRGVALGAGVRVGFDVGLGDVVDGVGAGRGVDSGFRGVAAAAPSPSRGTFVPATAGAAIELLADGGGAMPEADSAGPVSRLVARLVPAPGSPVAPSTAPPGLRTSPSATATPRTVTISEIPATTGAWMSPRGSGRRSGPSRCLVSTSRGS
jgi:hypothetical protein